jgi:hypothetical protein
MVSYSFILQVDARVKKNVFLFFSDKKRHTVSCRQVLVGVVGACRLLTLWNRAVPVAA